MAQGAPQRSRSAQARIGHAANTFATTTARGATKRLRLTDLGRPVAPAGSEIRDEIGPSVRIHNCTREAIVPERTNE